MHDATEGPRHLLRPYSEKIAELDEENKRLRELVRSFHSAMLCTLDTGMWPIDPEWIEQRMRELGIEVEP